MVNMDLDIIKLSETIPTQLGELIKKIDLWFTTS